MQILLLFIFQVSSLSLESIPKCKTPPRSTTSSSSIYDPITSKIITIGGSDSITNDRKPLISSFNLITNQFEIIFKVSFYEPPIYDYHRTFLRSDRKILVFGLSPEVNSFNLDNWAWTLENLTGDELGDFSSYGFTDFIYNGTEYVAIFGGLDHSGYLNDLFLIDVQSLFSKKMPKKGNFPSPRSHCSLVFYNDSLYMYGYLSYSLEIFNDFYRYDLGSETWEQMIVNGSKPLYRKLHYSYVLGDEMFIIYGIREEVIEELSEIIKFNFLTLTWTSIKGYQGIPITGASQVNIGSKVYLLYGRTLNQISNSIQLIDLSSEIPIVQIITPNFISPSTRYLHFSTVINQYMYMYGGIYSISHTSQELVVDMWRFDLEAEKWESILTKGQSPSKRKNSAICKHGGNRIFLFGGEFEDNYYNDLYFFYTPLSVWYKVEPEGFKINERTEACLASFGNYLFIVGGKSVNSGNSDIWVYLFENNRLEVLEKNVTDDGLSSVKCWVDQINENEGVLIIIGGVNYFNVPNYRTIKVSINLMDLMNHSIEISTVLVDPLCFVKKYSAVVSSGNKVISFGGYLYDNFMLSPLVVFDLVHQNCSYLPPIHEIVLYGQTAVHFKKNIYVFGGGGYLEIYKSNAKFYNNIYKISLENHDPISLNCSEGTQNSHCSLCPKGTFSSNGKCNMCPQGTFNDQQGSTNIDQCMPCPYGTFAPKPGSQYCLNCVEGFECPVGSSSPKSGFKSLVNKTVQPSKYKIEKNYLSDLSSLLWYGFVSFFIIFLIFSLISKPAGRLIEKFDIFVQSHDNELNKAVFYYKTKTGGIFSISFAIACGISIIISLMTFQLDNIIEIRGLVPVITLEDTIKASHFQLNLTLYTYGGSCAIDDKCHPKIIEEMKQLKYKEISKKCFNIAGNCQVLLTLKDLELLSKTAEIELNLKEERSFASALSLNLSVSSSIPDQISSVISSFKVPSNKEVLKGLKPSSFFYSFTPSVNFTQVFTSESNDWPSKDTGFHIDTSKEIEIGSTADSQHVNIQLFLKVKIVIEESDTAMETSRILRQTWFSFISAMLGSIFGLLGTFATGMGFFESCFKKIEKRQKENVNISNLLIKEISLRSEFNKWRTNHQKYTKVIPIPSLSVPTDCNQKTIR